MTTAPAYDNSVRIGYARVSTWAQEHQAQLDALAAGHCRKIIVEPARTRGDRPKLRAPAAGPAPQLRPQSLLSSAPGPTHVKRPGSRNG
jgi:hypothetical protein